MLALLCVFLRLRVQLCLLEYVDVRSGCESLCLYIYESKCECHSLCECLQCKSGCACVLVKVVVLAWVHGCFCVIVGLSVGICVRGSACERVLVFVYVSQCLWECCCEC